MYIYNQKLATMITKKKQKHTEQPKGIEMSIQEFLNFRELALPKINFSCDIWKGKYYVQSNEDKFMAQLGY